MSEMTQPTVAELLKYADLQMAAEAFLVNGDDVVSDDDLKAALMRGNDHSSRFTAAQASKFILIRNVPQRGSPHELVTH